MLLSDTRHFIRSGTNPMVIGFQVYLKSGHHTIMLKQLFFCSMTLL